MRIRKRHHYQETTKLPNASTALVFRDLAASLAKLYQAFFLFLFMQLTGGTQRLTGEKDVLWQWQLFLESSALPSRNALANVGN